MRPRICESSRDAGLLCAIVPHPASAPPPSSASRQFRPRACGSGAGTLRCRRVGAFGVPHRLWGFFLRDRVPCHSCSTISPRRSAPPCLPSRHLVAQHERRTVVPPLSPPLSILFSMSGGGSSTAGSVTAAASVSTSSSSAQPSTSSTFRLDVLRGWL
ncbi:hypothetical protein C8R45DRAFT_1039203 [Mycena sanguinolenta]|nr:hypothetical protein C8R45DRAFT_1039203 [Mycena sanguinolenta]